MNKEQLRKLQKSGEFQRLLRKQGIKQKKKHTLLILILIALIIYLIFTKANVFLISGLAILLVFIMR